MAVSGVGAANAAGATASELTRAAAPRMARRLVRDLFTGGVSLPDVRWPGRPVAWLAEGGRELWGTRVPWIPGPGACGVPPPVGTSIGKAGRVRTDTIR
ncbi:hypothetical protein GCM10009837_69400 [Streptomyces durmitorensis]